MVTSSLRTAVGSLALTQIPYVHCCLFLLIGETTNFSAGVPETLLCNPAIVEAGRALTAAQIKCSAQFEDILKKAGEMQVLSPPLQLARVSSVLTSSKRVFARALYIMGARRQE